MLIIRILGLGIVVIAIVIFGVDFVLFLKNRYCRYHIGRWKSDTGWLDAVYKRAIRWSRRSPTVKISDNSRYVLIDILQGKYRSTTIQSWQNASILLGILEYDAQIGKKIALSYLDKNGHWKKVPTHVDAGMLAYSILKSVDDHAFVKPAMDTVIRIIVQNTDSNGLISYTGGTLNPDYYVDTLGLVCPFLTLYAQVYNEPKYEEIAFKQLEFYHQYGMFKNTNLPNHAIDKHSKLPLGVFGWGRGTGWYVIGLLDTYFEMQNEEYQTKVLSWIRESAESYLSFQHENGGFGAIFQEQNTYDSSATAVMSYFFIKCGLMFCNDIYTHAGQMCMKKLKSVTRKTGAIDFCQGDTKGIGIFAQTYDIMPFAQGMTLRAGKNLYKIEI